MDTIGGVKFVLYKKVSGVFKCFSNTFWDLHLIFFTYIDSVLNLGILLYTCMLTYVRTYMHACIQI